MSLSDDPGDDVTIQQEAQETVVAGAPISEGVVWEGEPLQLSRDGLGQDVFWLGLLPTVQLPGEDVHPQVRAAAAAIITRQADLGRLRRDLAEREGPQLEALMRQLEDELDQDAAADQLARFEAKTKLLARQLPKAEEALTAAWQDFSAAYYASKPEQVEYLRQLAPERLQEALDLAERLQRALAVLVRTNDLIDGVGIVHEVDPWAQERVFKRSERAASVHRIIAGEDRGSEGAQFGLIDLVMQYRSVLTPPPLEPEPVDVVEPEPEPEAVRLQRERATGPHPMSYAKTHGLSDSD